MKLMAMAVELRAQKPGCCCSTNESSQMSPEHFNVRLSRPMRCLSSMLVYCCGQQLAKSLAGQEV